MELEKHYTNRTGWLRAAVLGANDSIISTTSLVIGIAAASDTRNPILLAALAGLVAHARDELGINEITQPKPLQAALASGASFITGGILPFLVAFFAPIKSMVFYQYGFAIVFLALSGTIAAKAVGSNVIKAVVRICFWGTVAMVVIALAGYIFGAKTD